jgi:hypothetical protein
MKMRTFLMCESLTLSNEGNTLEINKMLLALRSNSFPHEDNIAFVMVFDDVEQKPKEIEIVLLNSKDKALSTWKFKLGAKQNSCSIKVKPKFPDPGTYYFKISYDGSEFLGKYPFQLIKGGNRG